MTFNIGRYFLRTAVGIALCFAGIAGEAQATVLTATGTFDDGSILGGTLTIDPVVGIITAADLTISGVGEFVDIVSQNNFGPPLYYSTVINDATQSEQLSLGLFADSLVGYTGGELCSQATGACFASVFYSLADPLSEVSLVSGVLQGTSGAAPEPTSLYLSGCALAAGLFLLRRRIPAVR